MYDGNNTLQKCMEAAMFFENVCWQQCSSKMYGGSNVLWKCMLAAMFFRNVHANPIFMFIRANKGFPKLKNVWWQQCSSKIEKDEKTKRWKDKQNVWKSKSRKWTKIWVIGGLYRGYTRGYTKGYTGGYTGAALLSCLMQQYVSLFAMCTYQ